MSNPLLLDIVTFLTNAGVIKGDGVDTFRDFTPETPDSLISLVEYKGSPLVPYEPSAHRSIQVSVRDKNADAARSKALDIFTVFQSSLQENARIDFTEERWGQVTLRQTPFRSDTDSSDRVTYTFNIGITTTII